MRAVEARAGGCALCGGGQGSSLGFPAVVD